jgi:pentatricopeptide repeat protein
MYIRCRSLRESYNLFNLFVNRDEVTWGSIISGFVQDDNCLTALQLFKKMQWEGLRSNTIIFSCILQACGGIVALKDGMIIHNQIIIQGHESDSIVGSSLVAMYA